jgi:hypothetical protein
MVDANTLQAQQVMNAAITKPTTLMRNFLDLGTQLCVQLVFNRKFTPTRP